MLSPRYLGLGMPNMAVNCLAGKIYFTFSTCGFHETEGEMMRQAYEAFIVEVGLQGNILQRNFTLLGGLATKCTWFHNLWEFIFWSKVMIELDQTFHLQPARRGDALLMEKFCSLTLDTSRTYSG